MSHYFETAEFGKKHHLDTHFLYMLHKQMMEIWNVGLVVVPIDEDTPRELRAQVVFSQKVATVAPMESQGQFYAYLTQHIGHGLVAGVCRTWELDGDYRLKGVIIHRGYYTLTRDDGSSPGMHGGEVITDCYLSVTPLLA